MAKAEHAAKQVENADISSTHRAAAEPDGVAVRVAGKASEIADQPPLIALSVGTIMLGAALRRPVVWRSGLRMLASHLLATGVKTVLKSSIDRTRPSRALKDGHHIGRGDGAGDSSLNSFPSGHTAGAIAVAQAVAAEAPRAAIPLQLAALAVGALQPSRGKHYWSDVAAGAAIGVAAERTVDLLVRHAIPAWQRRCVATPDRAGRRQAP